MRINNITPVAFGYSKKSRQYLEIKAQQSGDKKFAQNLMQVSDFCNELEDDIRRDEKLINNNKEVDGFYARTELFAYLKEAMLQLVMWLYPDYETYMHAEHDYYDKSLSMCKDQSPKNWRNGVLDAIGRWDIMGVTKRGQERQAKEAEEIKKLQEAKTKVYEREKQKSSEVSAEPKAVTVVQDIRSIQDKDQIDMVAEALLNNAPSDVMLEVLKKKKGSPNGFQDIMGMEDLKQELNRQVIDPIKNPEQAKQDFLEYGKEIPMGIMLYGPPGCGKTFIVEALSREISTPVYTLDIGKAGSRYINQTSNNIKASFDYVKNCAKVFNRPVILFMDEMDSMTMRRDGISSSSDENLKQVATLLKEVEDAQKNNVIVIGASNMHELIDPAIRRRLSMKRFVGLPNQKQREDQLINALLSRKKAENLLSDDKSIETIAKKLEGYSYKSINVIVHEASMNALERDRADISIEDFDKAIKDTNEEKIDENKYQSKDKKDKKITLGFVPDIEG